MAVCTCSEPDGFDPGCPLLLEQKRAAGRGLVDLETGRFRCCGTDAFRSVPFHAAGCLNRGKD